MSKPVTRTPPTGEEAMAYGSLDLDRLPGAAVYRRCGPRDVSDQGIGINLAIQDAAAAANILAVYRS